MSGNSKKRAISHQEQHEVRQHQKTNSANTPFVFAPSLQMTGTSVALFALIAVAEMIEMSEQVDARRRAQPNLLSRQTRQMQQPHTIQDKQHSNKVSKSKSSSSITAFPKPIPKPSARHVTIPPKKITPAQITKPKTGTFGLTTYSLPDFKEMPNSNSLSIAVIKSKIANKLAEDWKISVEDVSIDIVNPMTHAELDSFLLTLQKSHQSKPVSIKKQLQQERHNLMNIKVKGKEKITNEPVIFSDLTLENIKSPVDLSQLSIFGSITADFADSNFDGIKIYSDKLKMKVTNSSFVRAQIISEHQLYPFPLQPENTLSFESCTLDQILISHLDAKEIKIIHSSFVKGRIIDSFTILPLQIKSTDVTSAEVWVTSPASSNFNGIYGTGFKIQTDETKSSGHYRYQHTPTSKQLFESTSTIPTPTLISLEGEKESLDDTEKSILELESDPASEKIKGKHTLKIIGDNKVDDSSLKLSTSGLSFLPSPTPSFKSDSMIEKQSKQPEQPEQRSDLISNSVF